MTEQQNTEAPITLGAYLKRLRNEKNTSVAEVAAKMYLHPNVIEALEQDDHENLPGPPYVFGYLRHYAKILDAPVDEVMAMYRKDTAEPRERVAETQKRVAETQKQVAETRVQPGLKIKQSKKWSHAFIYLVLFILVLALFAVWRSKYAQEPVANTGSLDYPITVVEHPDRPSDLAPGTEMEEPRRAPPSAAVPEPEAAPEPETAQETEPAPEPAGESPATEAQLPETGTAADSEPEPAAAYQETTITAGIGPDTVKLVLTIDCWIEIFDADNEKVFYDLARAGQTLVLSGAAPFSVLLGNADAATVEFNNTPFDITPHVTGIGIARFVLGEAE